MSERIVHISSFLLEYSGTFYSITSLLTPVLTLIATVYASTEHPKHRGIYTEQLIKVYQPLMSIFLLYGNNLTRLEYTKIDKIICENNVFVSPKLLEEWERIRTGDSLNHKAFFEIVQSNYNCMRETLGYVYSRTKEFVLYIVLLVMFCFMALILALYCFLSQGNERIGYGVFFLVTLFDIGLAINILKELRIQLARKNK